ncbi:hypothetical protein LR066_00500 [candidate division WOR-3 bacterium]|nr:hypothetical protein [candidate division WOR-3 bacterium]
MLIVTKSDFEIPDCTGKLYSQGAVIDVSDEDAKKYIANGKAEKFRGTLKFVLKKYDSRADYEKDHPCEIVNETMRGTV